MTHVGYGLTKDGKPAGLWPMPLADCQSRLARYQKHEPTRKYDIVPVYAGDSTTALVTAYKPETVA